MVPVQDSLTLTEDAEVVLEDLLIRFEEVAREHGDTASIEERIWVIEAQRDA